MPGNRSGRRANTAQSQHPPYNIGQRACEFLREDLLLTMKTSSTASPRAHLVTAGADSVVSRRLQVCRA